MKKLLFHEILLLSQLDRKARKVVFDEEMTTVVGANDTGKSCLLKSLFRAFGAEPRTHQRWESSKVMKLLRFSIDGVQYSVLQSGNYYSYYNSNQVLESTFAGITWDYCSYFAKKFDFNIQLPNSEGDTVNLPPSYYFLPFYIDQDRSWIRNWDGFKKLSRIPNWRQSMVEYHTGIYPNDYYTLLGQMRQEDLKLKELLTEHRVQLNILKRLEKENALEFSVNLEEFRNEIAHLLASYSELSKKQGQYKNDLVKLNNSRIQLETQKNIVERALKELKADSKYANETLTNDLIECPTCGAQYENSFNERFSIAQDEDRCYELLVELDNELQQIVTKIEDSEKLYYTCTKETEEIHEILTHKQKQVELGTLLEVQAKSRARKDIRQDLENTMEVIRKLELQIEILKSKAKIFTKSERRRTVIGRYIELMRSFLSKVDVHTLEEQDYRRIDTYIDQTGSDLPRSYLAYYYAILTVMSKFGSAVFAPIVIDAPNQQGQDNLSIPRILNFIKDHKPSDYQLILGTEDIGNVKMPGRLIKLKNKYSLLEKDEYETVLEEMKPYLDKSLLVVENG
jgi:hypothetical protein